MKGAFVTDIGRETVFVPLGELKEEEKERLQKALGELPEEASPSEWDVVLLLLTEEGVVAHRYAWRERVEVKG